MTDAPTCRHEIELTGSHHRVRAHAISVFDLPGKEPTDALQPVAARPGVEGHFSGSGLRIGHKRENEITTRTLAPTPTRSPVRGWRLGHPHARKDPS